MTEPMKQRVMIVDDHEVVRIGLKALLARQAAVEIVAEAASEAEAIARAERHQPDVILMDIRLGSSSGVDACAQITAALPHIKVVMLTTFAEEAMLTAAVRAGAAGYVLKQAGGRDILHALERLRLGEPLLGPDQSSRALADLRRAARAEDAKAFQTLSEQERRVLVWVARGKTNREIGDHLGLGEGTVRNYVSNILGKLGVGNRAEAAAYAIRHRLASRE